MKTFKNLIYVLLFIVCWDYLSIIISGNFKPDFHEIFDMSLLFDALVIFILFYLFRTRKNELFKRKKYIKRSTFFYSVLFGFIYEILQDWDSFKTGLLGMPN